jgi:hypothetical protein
MPRTPAAIAWVNPRAAIKRRMARANSALASSSCAWCPRSQMPGGHSAACFFLSQRTTSPRKAVTTS